ncbi:MocR-like pyridoxine biosynthesis transcription factor PdxR [Mycolicibacterium palauense]|uniref:MocR-like pyridoxine biosynthesis transcription factor PdxR n=1 Tax=Mycolicibacterium palauense TaxID=2034511 RepID=UPI001C3F1E67|nr:PLP-dependent aminotransferase family protein [Mycolicibacterium palauense]
MDRLFHLDPALPKGRAVQNALLGAVADGVLAPGTRLPSTRELAAELGISRTTVVAAIDDLIAEGVLTTRARAGIYVARAGAPVTGPDTAAPPPEPRFDLRPGRPERGSFPTARWLAATRRAAGHDEFTAGHGDLAVSGGRGSRALRTELAAYLARSRGVQTTPERIVVCTGFRGACTLLAAALAAEGAGTVAIEDPSLPGIDRPWRTAGFGVLDLPVDADGADLTGLGGGADAVLLTPSHQFPLGGALSPPRRQRICDWAGTHGGYLIEDDYDGEFRFDRHPIAALQRSAPQHTVYAGSTSKTLDPGLRLGWLVLPPELVDPVIDAADALSGGAPLLNQLALAELIRTGDYERHIRRQRREYACRRAYLKAALREAGHPAPGIPAGLHALVPLGDDVDPAAWAAAALADGVATHSLSRYSRTRPQRPAIVAGFATPTRARFGPAVAALLGALPAPARRGLSR